MDKQLSEEELDQIVANEIDDNVSMLDHVLLLLSGFGLFFIGTIWYFWFY